jgi:hypothetical protein
MLADTRPRETSRLQAGLVWLRPKSAFSLARNFRPRGGRSTPRHHDPIPLPVAIPRCLLLLDWVFAAQSTAVGRGRDEIVHESSFRW